MEDTALDSSAIATVDAGATVEIEVVLPRPWAARLEAVASRLMVPVLELASVLFIKGIQMLENLRTIEEFDSLKEEVDSQSQLNAITLTPMEVKH